MPCGHRTRRANVDFEMLTWDPVDFLDFLGVVPEEAEYGLELTYGVEQPPLRLDLSVRPYDGEVYLTLRCEGLPAPILDLRLRDCDAARRVHDERGDYLELAPGQLFGGRYDGGDVIPYGVRLRREPNLGIELFRAP